MQTGLRGNLKYLASIKKEVSALKGLVWLIKGIFFHALSKPWPIQTLCILKAEPTSYLHVITLFS